MNVDAAFKKTAEEGLGCILTVSVASSSLSLKNGAILRSACSTKRNSCLYAHAIL